MDKVSIKEVLFTIAIVLAQMGKLTLELIPKEGINGNSEDDLLDINQKCADEVEILINLIKNLP